MSKGTLYVIRHCATEYNASNWISGNSDVPIIDKTVDISCYSRSDNIKVYSSPLKRCIQTGNLLKDKIGFKRMQLDSRLKERNMGIFDGVDRNICMQKCADMFTFDGKFILEKTPPNGESFNEFYERVSQFWSDISIELEDYDIIVISHNQTLKVLYSIINGLDIESIWKKLYFRNGSLVNLTSNARIEFSGDEELNVLDVRHC